MTYSVTNYNRDGDIIEDLGAHIIRHDEFPEIWYHVARIAEKQRRKVKE